MRIALLPMGNPSRDLLEYLASELSILGDVEILERVDVPESAYRPSRGQYLASDLNELTRAYKHDKILGVTDVDIYEDPLNFVFGIAEVRGTSALISLHRLKDDDSDVFRLRATKEAFHELGHTFGLRHCINRRCVMAFSNCLADTDYKEKDYCYFCALRLRKAGIMTGD